MQPEFFRQNRQKILEVVESNLVVLSANASVQRRNDASYVFDQESNFWYLTGVDVADWWVIIETEKSWLVAPEVDSVHAIFDGSLSFHEAKNKSGVDSVISRTEGEALLKTLAQKHKVVAALGQDPHATHYDFSLNPGPVGMLTKLQDTFESVVDCRKDLAQLRAIKQPAEIDVIRRAVRLTSEAFEKVKSDISKYGYEYEIEADFSHYFRYSGSKGHAYDPIVAAGKNACTLHYGHNQAALKNNELILIDIGASVDGYAADITRTYSSGEATDRQKEVHTAVEATHLEIINLLRPGLDVREYHEKVDVIMKAAISELGLLKSDADYRRYFPHAVSHGLGIDVHDSLGGPDVFKTGMVLTVEPGIYIPEEGIGVRIEDDILITESGHENLSESLSTSL